MARFSHYLQTAFLLTLGLGLSCVACWSEPKATTPNSVSSLKAIPSPSKAASTTKEAPKVSAPSTKPQTSASSKTASPKTVSKETPKTTTVIAKPTVSASKAPVTNAANSNSPPPTNPPEIVLRSDLIHTVTLDIQHDPQGKDAPLKPSTADQILPLLETAKSQLVRMELLRRGSTSLPSAEKERLLQALFKRYQATPNHPEKFFDHGYAQLLYRHNKTGLFFLRKANDQLQTQFTNLAYAMAQVDADLNEESASPLVPTFRKLDAQHKLTDAVLIDTKAHQPGFWPSFVQILTELKKIQAYQDFASSDFSIHYVPYGTTAETFSKSSPQKATVQVIPAMAALEESKDTSTTPTKENVKPTSQLTGGIASQSCVGSFNPANTVSSYGPLLKSRTYKLDSSGNNLITINTYTRQGSAQKNPYHLVIYSDKLALLANLASPVSGSVLEDLDQDGQLELVFRQYAQNPLEPVQVYRFKHCQFELDSHIQDFFQ